jgi:hypothetical protein
MKVIINKTTNGTYAVTVRSARFDDIKFTQTGLVSLSAARAAVPEWKGYVAELEVDRIRDLARARYLTALENCQKFQDAYPHHYLFDEAVSFENATDGLRENGDLTIYANNVGTWSAEMFDAMTCHMYSDTGMRASELGLGYLVIDYGIKF